MRVGKSIGIEMAGLAPGLRMAWPCPGRLGMMACAMLMVAPMAGAQTQIPGTFPVPPGCTGFLTVQSRGCTVSNHYRCDADAPGDQWSANFGQDGLYSVARIDRETQWVESYSRDTQARQTLDPDPADPASFSDLLSKGSDSYDFSQTEAGTTTRVTGTDSLTGRAVTIDGMALQETEFDFAEASDEGTVLRKATGQQFISPDLRLFFSGAEIWDFGDGPVTPDGTPKLFVFPGEKGFFSTRPIFDCNVTSSGLQAPLAGGPAHVAS